jgi:excisionase family DNA binding protein/PAS domain S-box-containing protein
MPRASKRAQAKQGAERPTDAEATGLEASTVYTMAEAATLKGVSYHTVSRAVRRGQLPAQRLGRMALISAEDLRAWRPMRERAPHKYRRRDPDPNATPALVDLTMKDRVSLALELSTVIELLHEAAVELPLPDFMTLLAERFAGTLGLKRVVVWAVEQKPQVGRRLAAFGPPMSNAPDSAPLSELPVLRFGLALERATVVPWSTFGQAATPWETYHLGELLLAPLRIGGRIRGVLLADCDGDEVGLTADQLALAQGLANQAALALDRARLVEAERARADHLAAVLEHVSEPIFATDMTGRMSVMNAAGRSLLGIDSATFAASDDLIELVNKVHRRTLTGDLIPTEDVPLVRAARGDVVENQRHFVVTPDGTVKPVSVSARPILGPVGEPRGAVAAVRDITLDQALAERQAKQVTRLEAAAAHSGAVAEIALAVNAGTDFDESLRAAIEQMTTVLRGNHGALYIREADASLVPWVTFPAESVAAWQGVELAKTPAALIALSGRQSLVFTEERASPAERLMLAQLQSQAILLTPLVAGDEAIGAALIGYDDAAHLPSEAELRLAGALANQCAVAIEKARLMERIESAHSRLLAVVDHLPLGVIIVEAPSGRLVLANQAAEELVGGPVPDLVAGSLPLAAADGSRLPENETPLALTLATGIGRFGETFDLIRRDGFVVQVLTNHIPVRDVAGRVVGAVSVLQDVAQLQALDKAKDEFLSITAHELRNPLTSLHGNLQLMMRRMRGDPERADDVRRLESILAQSERLAQLVSRLLDASRAELGRLDLALAESDAAAMVRRAVDAARGLSGAHQLVAQAPAALPVVWDEVRIEQVLTNLLSNAIKYTAGGLVRVTAEEADGGLAIGVRDSGPGIPEHVRSSLFDRYVRGRRGAGGERAEGSGLGLGLYISRLIARAHGGDLTATNPEGGGALFLLTVPRTARPPHPLGDSTVATVA